MIEGLVWLAVTVATVVPLYRLLPHFGYNANWAFVAVIPLGVVVLLWVMASRLSQMEGR